MIIDDSVDKYYEMVNSFELLSFEREKELASIIRKFKGGKQRQKAREELMNHNLRLVVKIAFQFFNRENNYPQGKGRSELTLMDLISSGNVGLMKAVDLYNPIKFKTRFSTYATLWIKQGMLSLVYSYNSAVHVPAHIVNDSNKYKEIEEKAKQGEISDKEMMKLLKVTEKGLRNIRSSNISAFSMDIECAMKNESKKAYREFIPDTKQHTPYEQTARNDSSESIADALDVLDPVSRDIIEGQYLNPNKVRLVDLGKKHKISGERVRQIKEKALVKMKRELKKRTISTI
jgi:RNA polymerase primary sigma factor